ncbi:MAG: hypothetical protein KBT20_01450 [Bacteroidales bacterium]|nr:hypothetical protein [Candidatus Liminaster caballi]
MNKVTLTQPWRIVAAEIIAATKADPDSLRSIYEDKEFRPARNASVWSQLSARLAQARKSYREAVAGGYLKEVQHTMLRRCFAHDYYQPGRYMITLVVPERGSNPFGTVKGNVRLGRKGITLTPTEAAAYAHLCKSEGPLRLELTPLGATVQEALEGIPANYPMVEVRKIQIMPDHLHIILVVHAPIISSNGTPRHLGHVIAGYKAGCNKARRLLIAQHNCSTPSQQEAASNKQKAIGAEELCSFVYDGSATTSDPTFAPLWAEGYTDTIILSPKHMTTEEAYLDDNIFRLRMKQEHRNLLRTVLHIRINGQDFAALGNINLLRSPWKEQVQFHHWEVDVPAGYFPCDPSWHCQRFYDPSAQLTGTAAPRLTESTPMFGSCADSIFTIGEPIAGPTEAEAHTERLLQAGDGGAVFASPFISETEKAIRDAALTMSIPYICLTREGFRDLYTPTKSEFEACIEGNLLILAPWEDRKRTATITRRECMELNKIAATIAADNLQLLLVNDNIDNNVNNETITPRDDE